MKTLYDGEWCKVRPFFNKRFGWKSDPACEICCSLTCNTAWYSIKSNRFRCFECFTPKQYKYWNKNNA